MTIELDRRRFLQFSAVASAGLPFLARPELAFASKADSSVTIGWPTDVTTWDPQTRFAPDIQALYKMVYDQPLTQDPALALIPEVVTKWELAHDALSLAVELRDDVKFHDDSKMTADDFAFSFFGKNVGGAKTDAASVWGGFCKDIEVQSPTKAVMHFKAPFPTAPQWLAFLGSFIVPKAYYEKVGLEGLQAKPMGSGPYKVVDYARDSRIVLERFDGYWGPKPSLKQITIQVIKDPSARVAAIESGQVDLTTAVAVRDALRMKSDPKFVAELNPIQRVVMLTVRDDQVFKDENVRLAAHYAIDKAALSKAFYGNAAVPLSVIATPGTPGYLDDYKFPYDPAKAKELLAKSGYSTAKPVSLTFGTTNGNFPSDYDMARAIGQMWEKVGIKADIQVIEYAQWFELNRAGKLQDATIYSWDNAIGDPETYIGYMMNPNLPFNTFRTGEIGQTVVKLFAEPDYDRRIAGYRKINKDVVELGQIIPLLQTVQTLVRKKELDYLKYKNGWVLGQTMTWA
jgi:peptide/nickel transport system substrate-binding protein